MKTVQLASVVVFATVATGVFAQTSLNYVDPSADTMHRRSRTGQNSATGTNGTTANSQTKPGAKASPTPNGKNGTTKKTLTTTGKSTSTSGTRTAASAGGKGPAKGGTSGGSGNFEQTGKLQQVTEQMVDSIRTHKVEFDPAAAAADPSVILLNPRKLEPADQKNVKTDSLARPL